MGYLRRIRFYVIDEFIYFLIYYFAATDHDSYLNLKEKYWFSSIIQHITLSNVLKTRVLYTW